MDNINIFKGKRRDTRFKCRDGKMAVLVEYPPFENGAYTVVCVEHGVFNEVYSNGREWHGWHEKREMPSDIIGEWVDEED